MTLNQNETLWIPKNTRGNNIRKKMARISLYKPLIFLTVYNTAWHHYQSLVLVILCSHDLIYKQDCVINNSY